MWLLRNGGDAILRLDSCVLLSISTELLGYKFGQLLRCLLSANECLYKRLAYYCLTIYSVVLRSRTLLGKFSALFYFLYLHPPGFLPLRGFKEMLLESVLWFFSDVMSFESLSMLLYNIFVCGIVGSSINLKRKFWSGVSVSGVAKRCDSVDPC